MIGWMNHFDKLLVSGLLLIFVALLIHAGHDKADNDVVETLKQNVTMLAGLLSGLVGGAAMRANRALDKPPNGSAANDGKEQKS